MTEKDGEDAFVNQNFSEKDETNDFCIESVKNCTWTKIIKEPKAVEFQKQHLLRKLCEGYDLSPYDIFLKVNDFNNLLKKIVIPESILYAYQEGRAYNVEDEEMKAFISLNIFMEYHCLPAFHLYWSTDSQFNVPFVANCMTHGNPKKHVF